MIYPSILKCHKHSKIIKTHFYNDWLQYQKWLSVKSIIPKFVLVINVFLPICCHIVPGMPYLKFFAVEIVSLLGSLTDK